MATSAVCDLHFVGDTKCFPLYTKDGNDNKIDNITDWALEQFNQWIIKNEELRIKKNKAVSGGSIHKLGSCYGSASSPHRSPTANITKEDIFHYVYAVLHNPAYRKKYEQNLKRDFPRIPFYKDFWKWANWGKELMNLHIGYETADRYELIIDS